MEGIKFLHIGILLYNADKRFDIRLLHFLLLVI